MEWIEIREDTGRPGGAMLRIDGFDYPVTVTSPLDPDQREELDWYFEAYLHFPFTGEVRANEAAANITAYGEALFGQLVASPDAREAYGALKTRAGLDGFAIAIIGAPAFQELHWEALKDPRLPRPFALDVPIVRRRQAKAPPIEAIPATSPTLNLLVLTARPDGSQDVGYRTITRPLVSTLRHARLRVDVDFVRPGTWRALVERLEAATRDHGAGYYHAIHFDLHGGLLTYNQFLRRQRITRVSALTPPQRWGRGEIAPYDGLKAFLSFQPAADDPVGLGEASELADLLQKHRVPIVILNACQSGRQVGAEESSLAARLLDAGIQSALGMAWSVTVSAAETMIPQLYAELFGGQPLSTAVLAGRRALAADKTRRAAFNERIALEDWLLPVVYQNREPKLAFREFTPEEAARWFSGEASRFPEPAPEYGFFGRDLDVLRIETALLMNRNLLLIQGMGGSGKTTLLKHLAHWWELTGFTERTFYFGWDARAWTRAQILTALAPEVLAPDVAKAFHLMSEAAQQQAVAATLRSRRYLLILDNLESVTAAPLAIPHSLDTPEREALRSLLAALAGGQTLVLLGSRGEESWLAKDTFAGNVHALQGLDREAASSLADEVLRRAGDKDRQKELAFKELMALLAGFPLALQVVLPHLAAKTSAAVLEELRQGLAALDVAPGADPVVARTTSLMACIDYSHGHLDPEAQAQLACFAPFTGVINLALLEPYKKALADQPALAGLPLDRLGEVLERARGLGLLQRDDPESPLLHPQPALSWFLTGRLNAPDQAERRQAIERAFRAVYDDFAEALFQLQKSKEPQERQLAQTLVEHEYVNLGTALRLALDQQASIFRPFTVLSQHLDLRQDHHRGRELGELVLAALKKLPPEALAGERGVEFAAVIDNIALYYLKLYELNAARASYETALAIYDGLTGLEPRLAGLGRAGILHQLGYVAQQQRRFAEAETAYAKALEIKLEFNDRPGAARVYHQFGRVAQEQGRFAEAEVAYTKALEITLEFNDRPGAARVYHQFGSVAEDQGRFAEAEAAYAKALEIYVEFNDRYGQATTYHQLGYVAQAQRRFAEAEAAYAEALEIYVEFNDRHHAAGAYHNLGAVAQEQRRFAEAEAAYTKALEILVEFDDPHNVGIASGNLGRLWAETNAATIPATIARLRGISTDEAVEQLKRANESGGKPTSDPS